MLFVNLLDTFSSTIHQKRLLKGRRNILGAGEIVECDSLRRPYDGRGGGDKNVSIL